MKKKFIYHKSLSVAFLLLYLSLCSQEEKEEAILRGANRVTIGLGHTHLSKGKNDDGKITWLSVPSWSLNYDHWISNKWAIGLQTDVVIEKFIVEEGNGEELEREKPVALVPVAIFKPYKHFSFIAGPGVELEKDANLFLTKLGAEFGCELPKGWEAGIALLWDNKWNHYDSWVLEFSFSKTFFRKKK